jgi:hypothetical protein
VPILSDGVLSSISFRGEGIFEFDRLEDSQVAQLKSISKRQRAKYKRFAQVPVQVISVLWEMGFIPGEAPQEGMKMRNLAELLDASLKQGEANSDYYWLYEKIVKEEMMAFDSPKHSARRHKNLAKALRRKHK